MFESKFAAHTFCIFIEGNLKRGWDLFLRYPVSQDKRSRCYGGQLIKYKKDGPLRLVHTVKQKGFSLRGAGFVYVRGTKDYYLITRQRSKLEGGGGRTLL